MDEHKREYMSLFDENFKYNKIPLEVYLLPDLVSEDREILSRVIYWTRKGMPCTHTNQQFAELIHKSPSTAARSVYKLLHKKYVHAVYWNDRSKKRKDCNRELTACIGVKGSMQVKRMMAQAERKAKAKQRDLRTSDETPSAPVTRGGKHQRVGTTNKQLHNNYKAPPSPSPVKRASASPEQSEGKKKFMEELNKRKDGKQPTMSEADYAQRVKQQKEALGIG